MSFPLSERSCVGDFATVRRVLIVHVFFSLLFFLTMVLTHGVVEKKEKEWSGCTHTHAFFFWAFRGGKKIVAVHAAFRWLAS